MKTTLPTDLRGLPALISQQPRDNCLCFLVLRPLANDSGTVKKPHPEACPRAAFWGYQMVLLPPSEEKSSPSGYKTYCKERACSLGLDFTLPDTTPWQASSLLLYCLCSLQKIQSHCGKMGSNFPSRLNGFMCSVLVSMRLKQSFLRPGKTIYSFELITTADKHYLFHLTDKLCLS